MEREPPQPTLDEVLARHRAGHLAEAEAAYLRLAAATPDDPVLHHLLGVVAYQTGRTALAAERMARAVALRPDFPEALSNLGNALKDLGRTDEAVAHYRRAIAARPDFPEPHYNLGSVLHEAGDTKGAEACYREALRLRPQYADALSNLGLTLRDQDRTDEAIEALNRAIAINPGHTDALSNLGLILLKRDRFGEAIAVLRRAVASNPRHVRATANLGLALEEVGEIEAALEAHERAMALDPAFDEPMPNVVHLRRKLCLWDRFASDDARLLDQVRTGRYRIPPFIILHSPGAGWAEHRMAARRWASEIEPPGAITFAHPPGPAEGRLHVGYLSADLRGHPVGYLMAEVLERHDRGRVRVSAYSYGEDDASPTRRRLEAAVESFVDLRSLDDAKAAERIHADGVHILVDLTGYTTGSRSRILAARPAPVQVNWLGYAGTFGAPFTDWILADPAIAPPEAEPFFDERVARLSGSYLPFDTRREVAAETPSRSECGLPEDGLVFCCFHNAFKITPPFFDAWMRLLQAVPGSVIWLLHAAATTADNLKREAAARGVDPARLVFAPRVPVTQYLARHRLADLFLDVLPYNAHGSAADALWMGLPVLTLAGPTFPGRVAGRLLELLGLPELVTASPEEYEARALDLARHPAKLAGLRARLAEARATSPVFDMAGFTRDLEDCFERIWRERSDDRAAGPPLPPSRLLGRLDSPAGFALREWP